MVPINGPPIGVIVNVDATRKLPLEGLGPVIVYPVAADVADWRTETASAMTMPVKSELAIILTDRPVPLGVTVPMIWNGHLSGSYKLIQLDVGAFR